MTVHKVKMCRCGHEILFHPAKGPCIYGHGTFTGGCTCPAFGRRRRPDVRSTAEVAPAAPSLADALNIAIGALVGLRDAVAANGGAAMFQLHAVVPGVTLAPRRAPRAPKPAACPKTSYTQLRAGAARILEVVARHHPLRLTRTQFATLAGFAPTGGTYQTYLSDLRRDGLIDEDAKLLGVTSAGARTMLDVVVERGELTRTDLGEAAGLEPRAGTFETYLSDLRTNGLVEVNGTMVRLGKAHSEAR